MPLFDTFCDLYPACAPLRDQGAENLEYWKENQGNPECLVPRQPFGTSVGDSPSHLLSTPPWRDKKGDEVKYVHIQYKPAYFTVF